MTAMPWYAVAFVPIGYLLGSFPSAVLVARWKGHDVFEEGSGNPGASNVARILGWRFGAAVLLADFAKGAAAAGIGRAVGGRPGAYLVGCAAVVGHTYPFRRKGGKGVAAAGGMLVVLFPEVVVALGVAWVLIARVLHKASIASLLLTVAFPITVWLTGYDTWEVAVSAGVAALLVLRHVPNIRRLVRRQEIDVTPS
ncbi:MAG: acyl phosphate:glycerol-3-phosphate acyltransferase [Actinomycetota bacterium]|jgi:glycerol-3-phosphate acyltransferase PlsY|nr:acyl phosphate:glycerol-3-phosphate acyltransferase [Actinomycetota bacterium]